jgi:hypothetical protein
MLSLSRTKKCNVIVNAAPVIAKSKCLLWRMIFQLAPADHVKIILKISTAERQKQNDFVFVDLWMFLFSTANGPAPLLPSR